MKTLPSVITSAALSVTLTGACLLNLACTKRASLLMHQATRQVSQDQSTFSAYLGSGSPGGGGGDVVDAQGVLHLVAEQTQATPTTRKIVRNGSLDLLVADVGQTVNKLGGIVDGMGGYIEKSTQTNVGGRAATLTLRVPSANLDQLISAAKKLAVSVDRENLEARDVTREYFDLDARLRNAQAEEQQYLQILKHATTIKDTLDGAEKLSSVRGRIEQLQGEMKYLTTQVDMSSLEIALHGESDNTVLGIRWRPFRQAKVALVDMISGLAEWVDSVIAFFINLPLIAVWLISILTLIVVAARLARFLWRKLGPKTSLRFPWLRSKATDQVDSV